MTERDARGHFPTMRAWMLLAAVLTQGCGSVPVAGDAAVQDATAEVASGIDAATGVARPGAAFGLSTPALRAETTASEVAPGTVPSTAPPPSSARAAPLAAKRNTITRNNGK